MSIGNENPFHRGPEDTEGAPAADEKLEQAQQPVQEPVIPEIAPKIESNIVLNNNPVETNVVLSPSMPENNVVKESEEKVPEIEGEKPQSDKKISTGDKGYSVVSNEAFEEPLPVFKEPDAAQKNQEAIMGAEQPEKPTPEIAKPTLEPEVLSATEKGLEEIQKMSEVVKSPEEIKIENENNLVALVPQLEMARQQKDKNREKALIFEAEDLYFKMKGEVLDDKARELAKAEAEKEGAKIITVKEFMSPERIKKTEEKVQQRQWSDAIKYRWEGLTPEEQAQYADEKGVPNKDKFAMFLDSKLEELNKELSKQDLKISKDAYYKMMEHGYGLEPERLMVKGFWGRLFGRAVELPIGKNGKMSYSKDEFKELIKQAEEGAAQKIKEEAKKDLQGIIDRGRDAWRRRKGRHITNILNEVVKETAQEKVVAKEQEPVLQQQDLEEMAGRSNHRNKVERKRKKVGPKKAAQESGALIKKLEKKPKKKISKKPAPKKKKAK